MTLTDALSTTRRLLRATMPVTLPNLRSSAARLHTPATRAARPGRTSRFHAWVGRRNRKARLSAPGPGA